MIKSSDIVTSEFDKVNFHPRKSSHSSTFVDLQGVASRGVLHVSSYLTHLSILLLSLNLWHLFMSTGLNIQNVAHFFGQSITKLQGTSTHLYDSVSSPVLTGNERVITVHKTRMKSKLSDIDVMFLKKICILNCQITLPTKYNDTILQKLLNLHYLPTVKGHF